MMRIIFSKSLVIYARKYALDNNYNPGPTQLLNLMIIYTDWLTGEKDYPPYDEYYMQKTTFGFPRKVGLGSVQSIF